MNKQNHVEEFNHLLENDALLDIFSTAGETEEINHDSFEVLSNKNLTVLIIASGLGGGTIAELVSSMAAEKAFELLENYHYDQKSSEEITLFLKSIFSIVNDLILDYIEVSNIQGYATTLSIALVYKNSLYTAHIGKSRIYVIHRDDTPTLLSKDPSYSKKFSKNLQESEESYSLGSASYEEEKIFVTHEANLFHKEKLVLCSKNILDNINENKFDRDIEEIKSTIDEKPFPLSSTFLRYTHYERSIEKIRISVEDMYEETEIDWEKLMPFLKKIALLLGIVLLVGFFYLIAKGLSSSDTLPTEFAEKNASSETDTSSKRKRENNISIEIIQEDVEEATEEPIIINTVVSPIVEPILQKEEVMIVPVIPKKLSNKLELLQKKDSSILHVGEEGIRITFKENRLVSSRLGTFQISKTNPKKIYCQLNGIKSDLQANLINKLEKQNFSDNIVIKSRNKSIKINITIKEACSYSQSMWGKDNGLDLFIFNCEE